MKQKERIYRQHLLQMVAFFGFLIGSLLVLVYVSNLLLSFVLAVILSYLLQPFVDGIERMGLKRFYSIAFVFFFLGCLFFFTVSSFKTFFIGQIFNFQTEWPNYVTGFENLLERTLQRFQISSEIKLFGDVSLKEKMQSGFSYWATSLFKDLPTFLSQSLITFFLAPFFAFFMLSDGRRISRQLISLVPNSFFEMALNMYYQINFQMGQFIRARLLEAFVIGFIVFIGLYAFNFRYAVVLSFFAGVTNLIPYIGPIIGFAPALIVALLSDNSSFDLILVSGVYSFAQLIDTVLLVPFMVAKIVNLHPVTVVVVIIIGAQLMGILGMFISIPVACVMKVVISTVYKSSLGFSS